MDEALPFLGLLSSQLSISGLPASEEQNGHIGVKILNDDGESLLGLLVQVADSDTSCEDSIVRVGGSQISGGLSFYWSDHAMSARRNTPQQPGCPVLHIVRFV